MSKSILDRVEEIICQYDLSDNTKLAPLYADYSNRYVVEADCGDDDLELMFLRAMTDTLKTIITNNVMKQQGYYEDSTDDWKRWSNDER